MERGTVRTATSSRPSVSNTHVSSSAHSTSSSSHHHQNAPHAPRVQFRIGGETYAAGSGPDHLSKSLTRFKKCRANLFGPMVPPDAVPVRIGGGGNSGTGNSSGHTHPFNNSLNSSSSSGMALGQQQQQQQQQSGRLPPLQNSASGTTSMNGSTTGATKIINRRALQQGAAGGVSGSMTYNPLGSSTHSSHHTGTSTGDNSNSSNNSLNLSPHPPSQPPSQSPSQRSYLSSHNHQLAGGSGSMHPHHPPLSPIPHSPLYSTKHHSQTEQGTALFSSPQSTSLPIRTSSPTSITVSPPPLPRIRESGGGGPGGGGGHHSHSIKVSFGSMADRTETDRSNSLSNPNSPNLMPSSTAAYTGTPTTATSSSGKGGGTGTGTGTGTGGTSSSTSSNPQFLLHSSTPTINGSSQEGVPFFSSIASWGESPTRPGVVTATGENNSARRGTSTPKHLLSPEGTTEGASSGLFPLVGSIDDTLPDINMIPVADLSYSSSAAASMSTSLQQQQQSHGGGTGRTTSPARPNPFNSESSGAFSRRESSSEMLGLRRHRLASPPPPQPGADPFGVDDGLSNGNVSSTSASNYLFQSSTTTSNTNSQQMAGLGLSKEEQLRRSRLPPGYLSSLTAEPPRSILVTKGKKKHRKKDPHLKRIIPLHPSGAQPLPNSSTSTPMDTPGNASTSSEWLGWLKSGTDLTQYI